MQTGKQFEILRELGLADFLLKLVNFQLGFLPPQPFKTSQGLIHIQFRKKGLIDEIFIPVVVEPL